MYCARCGIQLAQSETVCPLCHLRAYHPDLPRQGVEKPYPGGVVKPKVSRGGMVFVLTALLAVALIFTFICNMKISHNVSWWKYVAQSLLLIYVIWIIPMWFPRMPALVWLGIDFVAVGTFLLFLNLFLDGDWFLSFAFPVLGGIALITCTTAVLFYYLRKRRFFVIGGAFSAFGSFMLLVEFLLNYTFGFSYRFSWSLYALSALCLVGAFLLIVGFCRPLREAFFKKMFL